VADLVRVVDRQIGGIQGQRRMVLGEVLDESAERFTGNAPGHSVPFLRGTQLGHGVISGVCGCQP